MSPLNFLSAQVSHGQGSLLVFLFYILFVVMIQSQHAPFTPQFLVCPMAWHLDLSVLLLDLRSL